MGVKTNRQLVCVGKSLCVCLYACGTERRKKIDIFNAKEKCAAYLDMGIVPFCPKLDISLNRNCIS